MESTIKAAVIERLLNSPLWARGDFVIANEFTYNSGERRADLVVVNGHLVAFEVKSHADTLERLESQSSEYSRFFEKTVYVVDEVHVSRVTGLIANQDELWAVQSDERDSATIRRIKAGKLNDGLSKADLLTHLTKNDLYSFLTQTAGFSRSRLPRYRSDLESIAVRFPRSWVREAAISAVKSRYRESFDRFMSSCSRPVVARNIQLLGRWEKRDVEGVTGQPEEKAPAVEHVPYSTGAPKAIPRRRRKKRF